MPAMQLRFEDLMFPILEMRTNVKHDPKGERAGTQLLIDQQLQKLEGGDKRYGMAVSVSSDNKASVNAPYSFMVEAYAIIHVIESTLDAEAEAKQIQANALSIMMGAIRERISEMTARAPWDRFLINPTPLPEPMQITYI
jgi:preprotein translocase subunit SecB